MKPMKPMKPMTRVATLARFGLFPMLQSYERKLGDVHGNELTRRELSLLNLISLEENDTKGEDLELAKNKLKQIDSEWIDSLKYDQRDCEEFKQFKTQLERGGLRQSEINEMLIGKQLKIATMNVKKLKLFMNKYKDDPNLVEKIRPKLDSIIREYYGRDQWFGVEFGAHPEYIMNKFIYNPTENGHFKLLRIDGNQVTYQEPSGKPIKVGLDEFLKKEIPDRTVHHIRDHAMIGEIYGILPAYNEVVPSSFPGGTREVAYLQYLMDVFDKKPSGQPSSEFFSVPYVPLVKPKPTPKPKPKPAPPASKWVKVGDDWIKEGGSHRTRHKCHVKKKKRTHKRRK